MAISKIPPTSGQQADPRFAEITNAPEFCKADVDEDGVYGVFVLH